MTSTPGWHSVELDGLGSAILGVSIALPVACIVAVGLRLWIRHLARCLGPEDWLICAALFSCLLQNAAAVYGTFVGLGQAEESIASEGNTSTGLKIVFAWHLLYICTWVLIKTSVCIALLRLTSYQRRRYILFTLIAAAIATAIIFITGLLVQCSPVQASWAAGRQSCDRTIVLVSAQYLLSAVNFVTDAVTASLSVLILGHIRMRRLVKISVGLILSLGILASITTVIRVPYLRAYYANSDHLLHMGPIVLLSVAETGISIVAASLPMLCKLLGSVPALPKYQGRGQVPTPRSTTNGDPSTSRLSPEELISIARVRSKRGPTHDSYLSFAIVETDDLRSDKQDDGTCGTTASAHNRSTSLLTNQ